MYHGTVKKSELLPIITIAQISGISSMVDITGLWWLGHVVLA